MKWLLPLIFLLSHSLLINRLPAKEPADTNYDESKVPAYTLPKLEAKSREHWETVRRAEVVKLLEDHVYGQTPRQPVQITATVLDGPTEAFHGTAIRRQIQLELSSRKHLDRKLSFEVLIYSPTSVHGKSPAFIGLNFSGNQCVHADPEIRMSPAGGKARGTYASRWQVPLLLKRGYGLVTAHRDDIDPDNYRHDFSDGPHPLFYEPGQTRPDEKEWGSIGGWAWALTRMREWLENDDRVDASRLAVIGHSRLGKTALWAGAQDRKFKMVISNNSGCGGAALYRRCYGERIHHMLKPVGYWFSQHHARYAQRESELPVDQHMLMAAIAPRALYVASATEDRWADPKGEFLAMKHATSVYALYGGRELAADQLPPLDVPVSGGRLGYHVRTGRHDMTTYDWEQYLDFADLHLNPGSR
jgi:hypothetical protein